MRLVWALMLLAMTAVWGWSFTVVKGAIAQYDVVPFLAIRFSLAALCLAILLRQRIPRHTTRDGILIGLALSGAYLFQSHGLQWTTPTNSGLITGLFVLFAPVMNLCLFGVRVRLIQWLAIATSLVGLVLLVGTGPKTINGGDLLTLGAAACVGLHVVLLDRNAHRHSGAALALMQIGTAATVFMGVGLTTSSFAWPSTDVMAALVMTSLLATVVGFCVQTYAQQKLSAIQTSLILSMEAPFAMLFGFWLAGDRLTNTQWSGAALLVTALLVAELYPKPPVRPAEEYSPANPERLNRCTPLAATEEMAVR